MSRIQRFCMGYFIVAMLLIASSLVPDWINSNHRLFGIWLADGPTRLFAGICAIAMLAGALISQNTAKICLYLVSFLNLANITGIIFEGNFLVYSLIRADLLSYKLGATAPQFNWVDIVSSIAISVILIATALKSSTQFSVDKTPIATDETQ